MKNSRKTWIGALSTVTILKYGWKWHTVNESILHVCLATQVFILLYSIFPSVCLKVQEVRREIQKYGGELSGVRASLAKSVKLKN